MTQNTYSATIAKAMNDLLGSATVYVALLDAGYTFSQSHDFFDDVSAHEITDPDYTAGGYNVGTITVSAATGIVKIDCADVVISNVTLSAYDALFYIHTGTAGTSRVIGHYEFTNAPVSSTDGNFSIPIPADGFATIDCTA